MMVTRHIIHGKYTLGRKLNKNKEFPYHVFQDHHGPISQISNMIQILMEI